MKRFYAVLATGWFFLFFCALWHTDKTWPGDIEDESGVRFITSSVIYKFNNLVWRNCHACGEPDQPVRIMAGTQDGKKVYELSPVYYNTSDNRLTLTILQNTFPVLLTFVLAIQIAFWAGRGDFNRWSDTLIAAVERAKVRRLIAKEQKEKLLSNEERYGGF